MRFDDKTFGWLNEDNAYPVGWNNITHDELKEHIDYLIAQGIEERDTPETFKSVNLFNQFISLVGISPVGSVLGIKIDDGGLVEQVNGPAIFVNADGQIVLRIGDNTVPVSVDGSDSTVGTLKGEIVVAEYGEGEERRCAVTFEYYSDVIDDSVEISFVLDLKERPELSKLSKGKLKKMVKDGELASLLRTAPSGESFVKPRDLEVGEYSVVSIEENEPHPEYGRSWKIVLEGVGPMMSTGKRLNAALTKQATMYKKWLAMGKPLTFSISNKEEMSQGIRVDCGFFKREPNPAKLGAVARVIQQVEEEVPPALPPAPTTVDVAVSPVPVEQPMLGEIPF